MFHLKGEKIQSPEGMTMTIFLIYFDNLTNVTN